MANQYTVEPCHIKRFWGRVEKSPKGCWLWVGYRDRIGYGIIRWYGRNLKAHRVSMIIAHGSIPTGKVVMHKCDVRNCVNPDHLSFGTQAENNRDCSRKGRSRSLPQKGEDNPMAKLTEEEVAKMKYIRASRGLYYRQIAKMFNVQTMTAFNAINGNTWGHLNE